MDEDIRVKFIVSEDVQSQPVPNSTLSKNILINPIFVVRNRWIPATLSLGVTILTTGIDFSKEHEIQITLVNRTSGEITYNSGLTKVNVPSGTSDNFTFTVELKNAPFENQGLYDINLNIDGSIYTDYFKVLKNDDSIK